MKAVKFPQVNVVYGEEQPEYEPLPGYRVPPVEHLSMVGELITCWELTPEELDHLQKTGKLWLRVWTFGNSLQPLSMQVEDPFV